MLTLDGTGEGAIYFESRLSPARERSTRSFA
jgi:hypothetical protein